MEKFKFLEHTADVKFKSSGKTISELYKNAALALFNTLYDKKVKEKITYSIKSKGEDYESLLYSFLEEFLILFDSENFLPSKIKSLKFNEKKLEIKAKVSGDKINNYKTSTHVKAITYNQMFVKKEKGVWVCQVVLDL